MDTDIPLGPRREAYNMPTEWKVVDEGADGRFVVEGTATSSELDYGGDVLEPDAIKKHLGIYKQNPLFCYMHRWDAPVGQTFDQELDKKHLRYKAWISQSPEHDLARMARLLISEGLCNQSSIGYDVLDYEDELVDGYRVRHLKEIIIHEVSCVSLGLNRDTICYVAKSLGLTAADLRRMEWDLPKKAVVPFQDLPKAPEDTPWRWNTAAKNEILGEADDWSRYKKCHLWWDPDSPDAKAGYKLPVGKAFDGTLKVVWRGCAAAMGALLGARGGVNIPEADQKGAYSHLVRYYKKFDKEPPSYKDRDLGEWFDEGVIVEFGDVKFHNDEKYIYEDCQIDETVETISGQAEGLGNIVGHHRKLVESGDPSALSYFSARFGDQSGHAEPSLLSEVNRERLIAVRDGVNAVLDAKLLQGVDGGGPSADGGSEESQDDEKQVRERAEYLRRCRETGSTDPVTQELLLSA